MTLRIPLILPVLVLAIPALALGQRQVHTAKHVQRQAVVRDTAQSQTEIDDFIDVTAEPVLLHPIDSGLVYPEAAIAQKIEGSVTLAALIEKDGHVSKVVVQKSDSKVLEPEAERLMRQARLTPAMQQQIPVRVWISKTIEFKLPK